MKRLVFLALLAGSLLLGGIGCGDDDDDGSAAGSGGADSGAAGGEAGSGGAAGSEAGSGGESEAYECGGDDAECNLLDANSCDDGYGCQFLTPSSGSGAAYAQCSEAGEAKEGESCDTDTPCAPGLHCNNNVCHQYCCKYGSASECPSDQVCVVALDDGQGGTSNVSLCDACDDCNPLTLDGCGTDQGCYPIEPEDASEENTGCRLCLSSVGDKEAGEPCAAVNECKPGLGCYSVEGGDLECVPFCDLDAATDTCEGDTTCQDSAGSEAMGLQVGICLTR